MGRFLTPLLLEDTGNTDHAGRELFKLHEDLVYEIGENGTSIRITVPKDYLTDFASVPKFFWRILPPFGKHGRAAVLHDFLCQCKNFSRNVGDALFYEAMTSLNVPSWKKVAMYCGVRTYWVLWGRWFNNREGLPYKLTSPVTACAETKPKVTGRNGFD